MLKAQKRIKYLLRSRIKGRSGVNQFAKLSKK